MKNIRLSDVYAKLEKIESLLIEKFGDVICNDKECLLKGDKEECHHGVRHIRESMCDSLCEGQKKECIEI